MCDGDYFYQYDAWGRLAQVNRMLGMTAADFDGEGRLLGSAAGHVGDLVAHYSYDGLGRLIVKTVLTAPGSSTKQHQHHYYDGVRRVQEQFYTESSGGGGTWRTRREYLHGTDYVDEYVLQVHNPACDGGGGGGDTTGHCVPDSAQVVYMLQDANYNVVATLDGGASTGCGGGTGGNGCGGGGDGSGGGGANEIGVYEQYTHEPYGQLAALDKFITTPPQNPVGHQGLFYDHYCATSPSAPCLQVAHKGLYQNRNRFYHPKLGRFTTPDPNSSALPLIEGAAYYGTRPSMDGMALASEGSTYSPQAQFGNGMNLFSYLGSNPVDESDALGLDWDDDVDSYTAEYAEDLFWAANKLGEAQRGISRGASLSAMYAVAAFMWDDMVWDRDEGILFDLALGGLFARACFVAGTEVLLADGTAEAIDEITVCTRVASMPDDSTSVITRGKLDPADWRVVRLQSEHGEQGTFSTALLRPVSWVTAAGAIPGEQVWLNIPEMNVAEWATVCSVEACSPEAAGPLAGVVTGTFTTQRARTISVHLQRPHGPIGVTPSHPFFSLDRMGWVTAGELEPGESVRTADGEAIVARLQARPGLETVYNIEVAGTHTYFVAEAKAWVHNGCLSGGGATLEQIGQRRLGRMQQVASKYNTSISLVGSRARGTANALSDWDLVVPPGTTSRVIGRIKYFLRDVMGRNIEVFRTVVDASRPHVTVTPEP